MRQTHETPETCPVCGADVPPRAKACPSCGADERTGWDDEKTVYDGLDLPDESSDHDETLRDAELKPRVIPRGVSLLWWLVAPAVAVTLAVLALRQKF